MTRLLDRKRFDEVLGSLVEKPADKPVLVPKSDKRRAMDPIAEDFAKENQ